MHMNIIGTRQMYNDEYRNKPNADMESIEKGTFRTLEVIITIIRFLCPNKKKK